MFILSKGRSKAKALEGPFHVVGIVVRDEWRSANVLAQRAKGWANRIVLSFQLLSRVFDSKEELAVVLMEVQHLEHLLLIKCV